MVDIKFRLVLFGFTVNPQFVNWYVGEPVVLAEIGELFIDVRANVRAVDYPRNQVAPPVDFFDVGWLYSAAQLYSSIWASNAAVKRI